MAWMRVPALLLAAGTLTFLLTSGWINPGNWGSHMSQSQAVESAPIAPTLVLDAAPASSQPKNLSEPAAKTLSADDRRGVYLTANVAGNREWLDKLINSSLAAGFNAIVIDVKDNSGTLAYESDIVLARTIGSVLPRYDLNELVAYVQSRGLYFIARQVLFSDPKLAAHQGSVNEWVQAHNPQAVAYNLSVAEQVAAAGVDEIQFDYIRYHDSPQGFDTPHPDRVNAVESFLKQARARVPSHVRLSADVFGRTLWDWNRKGTDPIGQVLERMSPYVDTLSPMIYPSHYEAYFWGRPYEVVHRGVGVGLERDLPLRPFLQAFDWRVPSSMNYVSYIREQIDALHAHGINAYLFWNPKSDYDALWAAMKNL